MSKFRVKMEQYIKEIYEAEIEASDREEALSKALSHGDWEQTASFSNGGEEYEILEEINPEKKVIETIISAIYNNPKLYRRCGNDRRAILDTDDHEKIVAKVFNQKRFLREIQTWLSDVSPESIFDEIN